MTDLLAKKLFQNLISRGGQSCPPRVKRRACAAGKTARRAVMLLKPVLKQLLSAVRRPKEPPFYPFL